MAKFLLTDVRVVVNGRDLSDHAVSVDTPSSKEQVDVSGFSPTGTREFLPGLERFGLPTELPGFPREAYLAALGVDKKKRDGRIRYVVLRRIGRAETLPLSAARILPPGQVRAQRGGRRGARWQRG